MKDTTKKTVPTGSTIKREQSTKNNETIAPTENSAILCKSSLAYVFKDIGFVSFEFSPSVLTSSNSYLTKHKQTSCLLKALSIQPKRTHRYHPLR